MAERLRPSTGFAVELDYPPTSANRPRWGHGRPDHALLAEILGRHRDEYRRHIGIVLDHTADLARIDDHRTEPGRPCWVNDWLLGLDTASIYALMRAWAPQRYVEVGSGNSTMVVRRAIGDGGLPTHVTSIDPAPRAEVDALCDRVLRQPLEDVDLEVFTRLEAGDVVFIDCSHRVFMNSDTTTFYIDVLPRLQEGVLVGIHDILLPEDYLPEWDRYWFNEQYVLAAYLLGGTPWLQPLLACNYVATDKELAGLLDPLWSAIPEVDRRGFCFWFRIGPR